MRLGWEARGGDASQVLSTAGPRSSRVGTDGIVGDVDGGEDSTVDNVLGVGSPRGQPESS